MTKTYKLILKKYNCVIGQLLIKNFDPNLTHKKNRVKFDESYSFIPIVFVLDN